MMQQRVSVPVPHTMREAVIAGDGFLQQMRARGWSVAETRPVYTDLSVIRQPWLVCPNGARYGDRAFFRLFDCTPFRKLIRLIVQHSPCSTEQLAAVCPAHQAREAYLTFLHDQELVRYDGTLWHRGKRLFAVTDIGHTLEWAIAEWFRLTYSVTHLIPVRHGVTLYAGFEQGDFDVVALLDSMLVTVECKAATTISTEELAHFVRRARLLRPAPALLLIDKPTATLAGLIARLNTLLADEQETLLTPIAHPEDFCWQADYMYVTGVEQYLSTALTMTLRVIEQNG